jgi:hypothetical protein
MTLLLRRVLIIKKTIPYGKRKGRDTLSKTPKAMMASTLKGSEKVQEKKNRKLTKLHFVKMKVIEDQTSESFEKVLQQR